MNRWEYTYLWWEGSAPPRQTPGPGISRSSPKTNVSAIRGDGLGHIGPMRLPRASSFTAKQGRVRASERIRKVVAEGPFVVVPLAEWGSGGRVGEYELAAVPVLAPFVPRWGLLP